MAGRIQEKRNKSDHILVEFLYPRDKEEILTSFQAKMWYLNEKIIRPSSDSDLHFKRGDRIASLLIFPIWNGMLVQAAELSESDRGESWNGSSGQ